MYSELAYHAIPGQYLFLVCATHFHLDWNWHSPEKISVDFYHSFLSSASGILYVPRATENLVIETRLELGLSVNFDFFFLLLF